MRLSTARYRLLFRQPFSTAHGTRDGTDSVFVRIEHQGLRGHGEATLPPYLKENAGSVEAAIRDIEPFALKPGDGWRTATASFGDRLGRNAPARNAVTMALLDLIGQMERAPLWRMFDLLAPPGASKAMVTLATKHPHEVKDRLESLPPSDVLKVKLGSIDDLLLIKHIKELDARPLLLDGNQGLKDVDTARMLIEAAGADMVGIEQPFAAGDLERHAALKRRTSVPVIGDESIQGMEDVRAMAGVFSAVNIKLMKSGGLDRALEMVAECRRLGLGVMLGSMSESSLGCLAMYHLAGVADLVDLDGPWLIGNDPFDGLRLFEDRPWIPAEPGVGARMKTALAFAPISA